MAKNGFDKLMSVGIDIGKDVFHLVGFDYDGQLVSATVAFKVALVVLSVTATLVGLVFKSASEQHNAHRYNY